MATLLTFRKGSRHCAALGEGWHPPEPGLVWSLGNRSRVSLPVPILPARFVYIELVLYGAWTGNNRGRPLTVRIDGIEQPTEELYGETVLGWQVERRHPKAPTIEVELTHPNIASLSELGVSADTRPISAALIEARVDRLGPQAPFTPETRAPLPIGTYAALPWQAELVRGVTALPPDLLFTALEGLGLNCEFGLAQRAIGVETLGLLRFASLSYRQLLRGLRASFDGIGENDDLSAFVPEEQNNFCIRSKKYGLYYHTFQPREGTDADALLARQPAIVAFRRRQLLDLVASGEKLFVLHRPVGCSPAQARPLARILRLRGAGALLFVTEGDAASAGSVTALAPRLFQGMFSHARNEPDAPRYGPTTWLSQRAVTEWVSVAANAYRLWREHGGGAAA